MQIDISNKIVQLSNQTISFGKNKEPSFGKNQMVEAVAKSVWDHWIANSGNIPGKIIELTAETFKGNNIIDSLLKSVSKFDITNYLESTGKNIDLSGVKINLLGRFL